MRYRNPVMSILGVAAVAATGSAAHASLIITIQQSGSNVVASGTGTLTTAGLSSNFNGSGTNAQINSGTAAIGVGAATIYNSYSLTVTGSSNYGSATNQSFSGTGTGVPVAIFPAFGVLQVSSTYVSGTTLTDTATWTGQTLAGMNLAPGSYSETYKQGSITDSISINILPVPEPAAFGVITTAGLVALNRRRSKA